MKNLILPIGLLSLYSSAFAQQMPERPNVLLIYADDIGYGDLSCNGTSAVRTPNVEKLASEGIRFTNAHCAAATSTPSRYALLTGEYAWRREGTGVAAGNAAMIITPERYTIADMFKDAGYQTIAGQIQIFGKLSVLAVSMPVLLALLDVIQNFLGA